MAASARHPRLLRAFPSWVISLHRTANKKLRPHEYAFKVPRQMTKFDVKEYLETVYGVKVAEVQTVNYDGACNWERTTVPARGWALRVTLGARGRQN